MVKDEMLDVGEIAIFEESFEVKVGYFVIGKIHVLEETGSERELKGCCDIISGQVEGNEVGTNPLDISIITQV